MWRSRLRSPFSVSLRRSVFGLVVVVVVVLFLRIVLLVNSWVFVYQDTPPPAELPFPVLVRSDVVVVDVVFVRLSVVTSCHVILCFERAS